MPGPKRRLGGSGGKRRKKSFFREPTFRPVKAPVNFTSSGQHIDLKEIIQNCIQGKRSDQNLLYGQLAPAMFTICLRYANSREEAKDLLQEGFIKVFECLHQFRFEGSFEGWVKRIMINNALQRIRGRSHLHAIVPVEQADYEQGMDAGHVLSNLGAKELLQMVQALPTIYRLVFNLYVFEGMKHKEIARMLNISEGTSKSNLHDARALLRKKVTASLTTSERKRIAND